MTLLTLLYVTTWKNHIFNFSPEIFKENSELASSVADWSAVQGTKNWTYLYWTPDLGYGQLNYTGSQYEVIKTFLQNLTFRVLPVIWY
jgi:hypothetical protein